MSDKDILNRIEDRIELYIDCYEGTPDSVIQYIRELLKERKEYRNGND